MKQTSPISPEALKRDCEEELRCAQTLDRYSQERYARHYRMKEELRKKGIEV